MKKFSRSLAPRLPSAARQRGVVLIIALVMLVVISLLATFSIRNALSSEGIAGNARTTELANQAAEIALRYCEDEVVKAAKDSTVVPPMTIQGVASTPLGVVTANWDVARVGVFVLPSTSVNMASVTFKRMPECVAERIAVVNDTSTATTITTTYLITARGFGPEVALGTGRPDGSEVFLQSTLEVE
jgi:type IV pilus assembly protein PilX